ncbi:hypothetical protein N7497_008060 [Penicillium chrysogenum]|nr:hypothetical protein N7497_008060 [Penicillium chrysogenum]
MSIHLVSEHISWGQAFANTREPSKVLDILANNPRSLNTGIVDIEVRPVPVAIKPKGKPFSHVNRLANHFVQRSPMSFLRQWAPGMAKILKHTQIHLYWNILQLKEAILRENCVVCGESSVQLYLPTMEPIIFGLDISDLIDPQALFLPQLCKIDFDYTDLGAWVVPIRLALTKALEKHGNRESIKHASEGRSPLAVVETFANPDDEEFEVVNQHDIYRAAKLYSPTPVRIRLLVSLGNYHRTAHHHEVSCRVPVVNRDNTRQTHYSCRGCTAMLAYNKSERISDANMRLMGLDPALDKYERSFEIFRRAFRVWTEADLIEHIRTECIAGWILLYFEGQKL